MLAMKRVVVAAAVALAAACEAFVGEVYEEPPCCETPCPTSALTGAVHVDPSGLADGGACGTSDTPCGSIATALAQHADASVFALARGTYVESVDVTQLQGTVLLCGAYEPSTWSRGDASSKIVGTGDVTIDDRSNGPKCFILDGIDVASRTANAGETLVGVFATRVATPANVCTRGGTITVAAGGDGIDGDAGANGALIPCAGDAGSPDADGVNGEAGTFAAEGFFNPNGRYVRGDGVPGASGSDGRPGAYTAPSCDPCGSCVFCNTCPNGWKNQFDPTLCSAGSSGCGGSGGGGGGAGQGGGASAAFIAVGVHANIAATTLTAGAGGRGGLGASGGSGAFGTAFAPAWCVTCNDLDGTSKDGTTDAGIENDGGTGGHGGSGSAGAGGWSCAVVVDAIDAGSFGGGVLVPGSAGAGSPPGQASAVCLTR
jgi:hypothetical protein